MQSFAEFETDQADQHVAALCHHFGRRVPVELAPAHGRVEFPFGCCTLSVDGARLSLTATADDRAKLDKVTRVVTDHLERFAFREHPDIVWRPDMSAT